MKLMTNQQSTRGDATRNPKQGYEWPQNRTCGSAKNFKKNSNVKFLKVAFSIMIILTISFFCFFGMYAYIYCNHVYTMLKSEKDVIMNFVFPCILLTLPLCAGVLILINSMRFPPYIALEQIYKYT